MGRTAVVTGYAGGTGRAAPAAPLVAQGWTHETIVLSAGDVVR